MNYKRQAGFGFIGMVIALTVVALLYFMVMKKYLANPIGQDKESLNALSSQGINPQNLPDTVKKAEEAVDKANKADKQIENAYSQPAEQK